MKAALCADGMGQKTNNSDLDLGLLQAMVLFQDIGLWSSDHLLMEITQGCKWRSDSTQKGTVNADNLFQT